jgi:hypothetical protein
MSQGFSSSPGAIDGHQGDGFPPIYISHGSLDQAPKYKTPTTTITVGLKLEYLS